MADGLTAFLSARLDEDEAAAAACIGDSGLEWYADRAAMGFEPRAAAHIARHDPARVLREVTAGREILRRHGLASEDSMNCLWCSEDYRPYRWPCPDVLSVAAVWSDHPDYRQEWKP